MESKKSPKRLPCDDTGFNFLFKESEPFCEPEDESCLVNADSSECSAWRSVEQNKILKIFPQTGSQLC